MKKTNPSLKLQYTTVRTLTSDALARVAGGKSTVNNTDVCSASCNTNCHTISCHIPTRGEDCFTIDDCLSY